MICGIYHDSFDVDVKYIIIGLVHKCHVTRIIFLISTDQNGTWSENTVRPERSRLILYLLRLRLSLGNGEAINRVL